MYFADLIGGTNRSRQKFCEGQGMSICPQCSGSLQVRSLCNGCQGMRRIGACTNCQARGETIIPCPTCPPEHKGKVFKGCEPCNGTGVCPVCKGLGHRN
jgi:hypothetical protein